MGVVVVATLHSKRFEFFSSFIKELSQRLALFWICEIAISRHNQKLTTKDLVELSGAFEFVAAKTACSDMRGGSDQLKIVQFLPQLFGFASVFVIPGKFHAGKAHFGQPFQSGVKIFRAIVTDRIKLNRNARVGFGLGQQGWRDRTRRGGVQGGFYE